MSLLLLLLCATTLTQASAPDAPLPAADLAAPAAAAAAAAPLLPPLPPSAAAAAAATAGAAPAQPAPLPLARAWPAWVITLARTPGRLARFRRSSSAYEEFPRLQEFPATDGRTLDVVRDQRISARSRVRSRDAADRRSHSDLQSLGMSGLYISHVEVWRAFLASGEPLGLVLEDDAVVERGMAARLDAALAGAPPPEEWDVWLVGALALRAAAPFPPGSPFGAGGWLQVTDWWGTQAYLLTRRGAAALLAHAYPADAQIDAYMAQMAALGEVLAVSREGIDIPQFAWYTLGGTTVQMYAIYCDACDLPHSFSLAGENARLRMAGVVAGVAVALLWQPAGWLRRRCAAAGVCAGWWCCACCAAGWCGGRRKAAARST